MRFPIAKLKPPSYLDEIALEEWHRIVPLLDGVRILSDADLFALANYCNTVSVAIRAATHVNENGLVLRRIVNPHIKIAREARAECLRFAVEFGLTPASRSRVSTPEQDKKDAEKAARDDATVDVPLFGVSKLGPSKARA